MAGFCEHDNEAKGRETSWLAQRLSAFQEGLMLTSTYEDGCILGCCVV
jgi:hypothetical protein